MKQKKEKKFSFKMKIRLFLLLSAFGGVISILGYNCVLNLLQINNMKQEKEELEDLIVVLRDEEKVLNADVEKLSDPIYIAKYAREKYLYSKDGELIIRMNDE